MPERGGQATFPEKLAVANAPRHPASDLLLEISLLNTVMLAQAGIQDLDLFP